MEPPWVVNSDYFADGKWILGESDYLKAWREWFVALPEDQKASYREMHPLTDADAVFYDVFGKSPHNPKQEAERFRDRNGVLVPPWLAFPHIGLGSIGWRMGAGEDYWHVFADWYRSLSEADKSKIRDKYPEPAIVEQGRPWTGFFDRLEENYG